MTEPEFNNLSDEHDLCAPGNYEKKVTEYYKTLDGLATTIPLKVTWKCKSSIIEYDVYNRDCSNFPSADNHLGNSCVYRAEFDNQGTEAHQRDLLKADWEGRKPSCGINIKTNGVCNLDQVGTCLSGIPGTEQGQDDDVIWQCSGINGGLNNLVSATDTTSQPHCKVKKQDAEPSISCAIKPIYGTVALVVEAEVKILYPGFKEKELIPPYYYQIDFNHGSTPAVKASSSTLDEFSPPWFTYTKSGKYLVYYNIKDDAGKYAPCYGGTYSADGWCPCGLTNYEVEVKNPTRGNSSEASP